jgi:hypothetical protein
MTRTPLIPGSIILGQKGDKGDKGDPGAMRFLDKAAPALTDLADGEWTVTRDPATGETRIWQRTGAVVLDVTGRLYAARFGVIGDTGADQGPALRRALVAAQLRGATLILPSGVMTIGPDALDPEALLRITKPMSLVGDGRASVLLPMATAGSRAVVMLKPDTNGGGIRGAVLRGFAIGVLGVTRYGGDGILLDTTNTNGFIAKLLVENVGVADAGPGNYAIRHLNDPGANPNGGLFATTFRDNDLFGGLKFVQTGDSNNIERNIISGSNTGVYYEAIVGAATHRIEGNNITAAGGAIYVKGGQQVKIVANQLEQVVDYTGSSANPAVVVVDGASDWVVRDNNINAYDRVDCVYAVNNARFGQLGPNTATYADTHVLFKAVGAPQNAVERQHVDVIYGGVSRAASRVSVDAASPTYGVFQQLSLQNGWVGGPDPTYRQGLFWMPMTDGSIRFAGTIADGTMTPGTIVALLPTAFAPTMPLRFTAASIDGAIAWGTSILTIDQYGAITTQAMQGNVLVQLDGVTVQAHNP